MEMRAHIVGSGRKGVWGGGGEGEKIMDLQRAVGGGGGGGEGGPGNVDTTNLMRQDWDERARKDAFHYIASWRKDWTPESFFQSGEEDYKRYVLPVFKRWRWEPQGKAMLELGCGAGRMTRSFAQKLSRVYAFDISAEMLGHA